VFAGIGANGNICVFSSADTDLIVDVNGQTTGGGGATTGPPSVTTTTVSTSSTPVTNFSIPEPTAGPSSTSAPTTIATSTTAPPAPSTTVDPAAAAWDSWLTSPTDEARRLVAALPSALNPTDTFMLSANHPQQIWLGVGAALTDSSVSLFRSHPELISELYSSANSSGAHLNLLRLPLSATDFSTEWWTWGWDLPQRVWLPPAPAVNAARTAGDISAIQPDLSILAVPWTAPAAMKTTRSVAGGSLSSGQESNYAGLLVQQVGWLLDQGLPVDALSVVNEPGHSGNYPTMTMTDAQLATVGMLVRPHLAADEIELWSVDHNWSDRARVDAVSLLAPGTFDRAAFHCYSGWPSQMLGLDIASVVSECTGTTDSWTNTFQWDAENLIFGSIEAGSTGLLMWNLLLDERNGPKAPGGCETCRGLLTVDSQDATVRPTPEYYALAHLSRAADPGATVLEVDRRQFVTTVAFLNPDGTLGVFGFNRSSGARVVRFESAGAQPLTIHVQPHEYFTVRQSAIP